MEISSPVKTRVGASPLTANEYSFISGVDVLQTKSDFASAYVDEYTEPTTGRSDEILRAKVVGTS
jgi:hypothetical protein